MIIAGMTIANPKLPIVTRHYRPSLRPEFESNDVAVRDLNNRTRRMWTFNWEGENMLFHSQYDPLITYLMANMGNAFSITLPYSTVVIGNVYCLTDDLNGEMHVPHLPERGIEGLYKLQLQVGEL